MTHVETGTEPAVSGANAGAHSQYPSREDRLETLIRRILPGVNLGLVGPDVRQALMRDFSELRNGGTHAKDVPFESGRCLMWYDCPILVTAQASGREAFLMRIPEDEAGANYLMMIASPRVMNDLKEDKICLRTACLHEQTQLYLTDDCVEGVAQVLHGPVHEFLLPEPDFFVSEYYATPDEDEPAELSM
jgi:hypothetical protein